MWTKTRVWHIFVFFFIAGYNFKIIVLGFRCIDYQDDSAKDSIEPNKTHRENHSLKRFKCDLCPYSATYRSALNRHSLVHSGERPHKCDKCNQSFTLKFNLRRHMLVHTVEKPYWCHVCNKHFTHRFIFKRHESKYLLCE